MGLPTLQISGKLYAWSQPFTYPVSPFLDPEGGSPNAALVVLLLVVVISSLKISKAFLICSGAQRNFAYAFVLSADIPQRSTVSDLLYFSCIIKVRLNAGAVRLAVVRSDEYLCTGDKRGLP